MVKDYNGKEFESITELCQFYNISKSTYRSRIKNGWPPKCALLVPVTDKYKTRSIKDHLGNKFKNLKDMLIFYNISVSAYQYRITHGWSLEKTLTTPVKKEKKEIIINQIHYKSVDDVCQKFGISRRTYFKYAASNMLEKLTLSKQDTHPHKGHSSIIILDGKEYHGWKEVYQKLKLHRQTIQRRLKNGMSEYDAINQPSRKSTQVPINITIDHLGNKYASFASMCHHYGQDPSIIKKRVIENNWPLKCALLYTTRANEHILLQGYNDLCTTHPQLASQWHPTKNSPLLPSDIGAWHKEPIWWLCKYGHEYKHIPNNKRSCKCPYCKTENITYAGCKAQLLFTFGSQLYYGAICETCGFEAIMTPQEMAEHNETCHKQKQ